MLRLDLLVYRVIACLEITPGQGILQRSMVPSASAKAYRTLLRAKTFALSNFLPKSNINYNAYTSLFILIT